MKLLIALLALSLMGCEKEPKPLKKVNKEVEDCRKYTEPKLDWKGWKECTAKRLEAQKARIEALERDIKAIDFKDEE